MFYRLSLIVLLILIGACEPDPNVGRGFRLPEGNVEAGHQAFIEFGCPRCHSIAGVELPRDPENASLDLELGGEISNVKTYGELVTSIINPDHVLTLKFRHLLSERAKQEGDSPMPTFNKDMSVEQMIDLVAFLHAHYVRISPDYVGGGP